VLPGSACIFLRGNEDGNITLIFVAKEVAFEAAAATA
jgi:hypothetical protein